MGVSNEAKNVILLKFLRKIKKKNFSSCELNPGTYGRGTGSKEIARMEGNYLSC
jgi:hypothetical protein